MRSVPALLLLAATCFAQGETEYVFGFLRAAPNRAELPREKLMEIQKGHMAHLGKMARDGILMAAGPLGDSADLRGILIFRDVTLDQARAAALEDPAVAAGRLRLDLASWTGPAAIGERVAAQMKADPEAKIPMTLRGFVIYWRTPATPANPDAEWAGHSAFLRQLQASGEVLAAGDLRGSAEFAAVVIFAADDVEAALKRCREDPIVQRGLVRAEGLKLYIATETFTRP